MRHYISGAAGSDEWKEKFRSIREAFQMKLRESAKKNHVTIFLSCTIAGEQQGWVWNESDGRAPGLNGTLEEACQFAANMIEQGMFFAFAVDDAPSAGPVMWLTTWEEPDFGPRWPVSSHIVSEESREGVFRADS